ncbi:hypothetical protein, partial [Aeromonas caviae]|uniref:hypothetical protein n=1 Tax=Aeromonas caviae TaxID=648 RepID=UPI0040392280
ADATVKASAEAAKADLAQAVAAAAQEVAHNTSAKQMCCARPLALLLLPLAPNPPWLLPLMLSRLHPPLP